MSAVPCQAFSFRPMNKDDVDAVMALERTLYAFPWTPVIAAGCLNSARIWWAMRC